MGTQIIGTLILLIIATYVIQGWVPRARGNPTARRTSWRADVAPLIGCVGITLLGLSLAQAVRRAVFDAWASGLLGGLVIGAALWVGSTDLPSAAIQPNRAMLLATLRFLQSYGSILLASVLGLSLAIRILGAVAEAFVAGGLGVVLIVLALRMFVGNPRS